MQLLLSLKKDFWKLFFLFFLVSLASALGFNESAKRERDVRRNEDISNVAKAIEAYKQAFGYYPESKDGKIVACAGNDTKVLRDKNVLGIREKGASRDKLVGLAPCEWGQDPLRDVSDGNYPAFLDKLPQDPESSRGFSYRYDFENGRYFVYVAYETKRMPDYSKNVLNKKVACGYKFCNGARTNGIEIVK